MLYGKGAVSSVIFSAASSAVCSVIFLPFRCSSALTARIGVGATAFRHILASCTVSPWVCM